MASRRNRRRPKPAKDRQEIALRKRSLHLETLERREMLSISQALWTEQGPGPILTAGHNGYLRGLDAQGGAIAGAVNVVATHPTNPEIMFVGTANGGIWRTNDAVSGSQANLFGPDWTPLTDNLPALSIGDLEFDLTQPN